MMKSEALLKCPLIIKQERVVQDGNCLSMQECFKVTNDNSRDVILVPVPSEQITFTCCDANKLSVRPTLLCNAK